MEIPKKIKCVSCGAIINVSEVVNAKCDCGKVCIVESHIIAPTNGYVDISPKLLNE